MSGGGFDQLELFGAAAQAAAPSVRASVAPEGGIPAETERPGQPPTDVRGRRPAGRRYVPEWEREQQRLAAYRRRARADDGEPWSVDECWPLFRPSLERYLETRRRERGEAK